MGWFLNLSTRSKLFLSMGMVLALLLGVAVTAYNALSSINPF